MKTITSTILVLFKLFILSSCHVVTVFYEGIKDCSKEIGATGSLVDVSNFDIISTDDSHTFLNGTIKFDAEIKQPWKGKIYSEKYDRGEWVVNILDRNVDDICQKMKDPMSPLYLYFYDQPQCPIKPGTKWTWKMRLLVIPRKIPASIRGEWRLTMIFEGKVNEKIQKHCLRIRYDIFEYSN